MSDIQPDDGPEVRKSKGKRNMLVIVCLVLLTATSLAVGIALNLTLKDKADDTTAPLTASFLVDCHPDKDKTEAHCKERGCIWVEQDDTVKRPKCSFPEAYGYVMLGDPEEDEAGVKVTLTRIATPALLGMEPYENLTVSVEFHNDNRLRIKIVPTGVTDRYEVPEEALNIRVPQTGASNVTRLYDVTFTSTPVFGVAVTRRSTNVTIFNTTLPGLAYYPQFLQISTHLSNSYLYGFGEHRHETFRHDMNHRTWVIFTRDAAPDNNYNLYGAHPVYMNVEDDGKANMVFLKNSNAMEVDIRPDPSLTFRTIGGVLDFYIFLGDSPGHAVSLYTEAIGRPVLPPHWALGFQLSRWGYTNISDMRMVIERNRAAQIPYDVQWSDIDSMFKKFVFTYDRAQWDGLPALVDDLHSHHQRFVTIIDPGVGANQTLLTEAQTNSPLYHIYSDGAKADVDIFVKNANDSILMGEVWAGMSVYPDYSNKKVLSWLGDYTRFYREAEGVKVDALWIDMNEPSSFVPGSADGCNRTTWDFPPYVPDILGAEPEGKLFDKTICMTSEQAWGRHYDVHSLYAHAMAMRTNAVLQDVLPGKRPWTMTRSSFAGTGYYATKWMGDNHSRWPFMRWSIIGILEFSMFGFAMNGADICGFYFEATYEMCVRWHQLGAFYPFARNHNALGDDQGVRFRHQDPAAWGQKFVDLVKGPLMTRYRLLPHLYSLFFRATLLGETVMRPLMFEFPRDLRAREIDRQFLLGSALLISPVLEPNVTSVDAYFPDARWYEYSTGEPVAVAGASNPLYTPLDKFNLHVRGGHVIPWQEPALNTVDSRKNPMGLIVALDESRTAQGDLFLDDGESHVTQASYSHVTFKMDKAGELKIAADKTDYTPSVRLAFETVEIYGLPSPPRVVLVDGASHPPEKIKFFNKMVRIVGLQLPILLDHNITWSIN